MIDKITLTNQIQYVRPNKKKFGTFYNQSQFGSTGTVDSKYRLYKRDLRAGENQRGINEEFITVSLNSKFSGFKIIGNLRKWWFGKNNIVSDFNYISFCACVTHLAHRMSIPEEALWESAISYVEIGANVRLSSKFDDVIASAQSFPRRKRFGDVDETVYFKTQNTDIIIYDKITHAFKKTGLKENARDRLLQNMFLMRYEIKLRNIANTVLSDEVKTLGSIKENWNELLNYWEKEFYKIKLINQLHPPVNSDKPYLKKSDVSNFLIRRGILAYGGVERLHKLIYDNMKTGEKKEALDFYIKVYNDHNNDKFDAYKEELYNSIRAVKQEMMEGFDIGTNNIV